MEFLQFRASRFNGGSNTWAGQGRCGVCEGARVAEFMAMVGASWRSYCGICKDRSERKGQKAARRKIVALVKSDSYYRNDRPVAYWYGFVISEDDPQKHLACCMHKHRTEALAMRCARKLRKVLINETS